MNDLLKMLKQNPIFAQLSEAQRSDVVRCGKARRYERGELIALYDDIYPYILIVATGKVDGVMESREGRRLVMIAFQPGDVFWGLAFFNPEVRMPVTLEAHEASLLYLWNQESLLPILLQNSKALWELCRLMMSRMQQASVIVEGLAFQSVAVRVARLMLGQFSDAATPSITRHLTLDEMAAMVGTTQEMVCRVLYHFADKKLIQITRTEFVLDNKEGLAEIAES